MKHSHTILYVDDDPDDLQLLSEAFMNHAEDLHVVNAQNGLQGLQELEKMKVENNLPCLIIIDINMPILDGLQTLVRMKNIAEFKQIPIVLFSTSTQQRDRDFARKWGADYRVKPSNFQNLEELIQELLSRCKIEKKDQY